MFATPTDTPAGIFPQRTGRRFAAHGAACTCPRRRGYHRHPPALYLLPLFFVLASAGFLFIWTHPGVDIYLGAALMLLGCALATAALTFGFSLAHVTRRSSGLNGLNGSRRRQDVLAQMPDPSGLAPAGPATLATGAAGGGLAALPAPSGPHENPSSQPSQSPRFAQLRTRHCSLPCDSTLQFSVACFETDCSAASCAGAPCQATLDARGGAQPLSVQIVHGAYSRNAPQNTPRNAPQNMPQNEPQNARGDAHATSAAATATSATANDNGNDPLHDVVLRE